MKLDKPLMRKILKSPYIPPIIAVFGLLIVGESLTSGYISMNNISSLLMTVSILSLVAMGQSTVVISGGAGIDLSVGAVMSLTALLGPAAAITGGFAGLPLMIVYSAFMGGIVGLLNGMGTQLLKVAPLVMTLIMATVVDGFVLLVTRGLPTLTISDGLQSVTMTVFGPIRLLTLTIMVFIFAAEFFFLRRSKFWKLLVLTGNNINAARLSGISVRKITIAAYTFGGMMAGLAGLALVGFAGTAQMQMGRDYTLLSVAAVVIGGTKLSGGKGSYIGGILGAMVLVLLTNILQTANMPPGLRLFFQGLLFIIILMVNSRSAKLRQ